MSQLLSRGKGWTSDHGPGPSWKLRVRVHMQVCARAYVNVQEHRYTYKCMHTRNTCTCHMSMCVVSRQAREGLEGAPGEPTILNYRNSHVTQTWLTRTLRPSGHAD